MLFRSRRVPCFAPYSWQYLPAGEGLYLPLYPYYKWKGVFCQTAAKVVGFRQKVIYCAAFLTPPVRNGRKCHSVWKLVELCRNGKGRRPLPWDDGLLMVCYHSWSFHVKCSFPVNTSILHFNSYKTPTERLHHRYNYRKFRYDTP